MKRRFVSRADLLLFSGATMINVALIYGAGMHLGWWSWLLWLGIWLLYAGIKLDAKEDI